MAEVLASSRRLASWCAARKNSPTHSPRLIFFACTRSSTPLSQSLGQATEVQINDYNSSEQMLHQKQLSCDVAKALFYTWWRINSIKWYQGTTRGTDKIFTTWGEWNPRPPD